MFKISLYGEITDNIVKIKSYNNGFLTNFFLTKKKVEYLIKKDALFAYTIDKTFFILRKNENFHSLYYISSNLEALTNSLNRYIKKVGKEKAIVVDIVGADDILPIKNLFTSLNFTEYTYLVRMSRMNSNPDMEFTRIDSLRDANEKQVPEILQLFDQYFDPKAEQLPTYDDLLNWIELGTILIYEINNKIAGFIIYELNGVTLYLRYWFVHPDHRDKQIGSALFKCFLYRGKNTKRQLFWVINTNDNAIKRYEHYGFNKERMYNFVLINKEVLYEG